MQKFYEDPTLEMDEKHLNALKRQVLTTDLEDKMKSNVAKLKLTKAFTTLGGIQPNPLDEQNNQ